MYQDSYSIDCYLNLSSPSINQMHLIEDPELSSINSIEPLQKQAILDKVNVGDSLLKGRKTQRRIGKDSALRKKQGRRSKNCKTKNLDGRKQKRGGVGPDYRKNICGYVVKKVIRQLADVNYAKKVSDLCIVQGANYDVLINFYSNKIQGVTGPSHIPSLLTPSSLQQLPIIKVFLTFLKWFLEQRYVRHLLIQGKMEVKKAYIEYKNKELMPLIQTYEKKLQKNNESSTIVQEMLEQI